MKKIFIKVKNIILFLIFIILLKTFLFDISYISSGSMESTVNKGDYILINKIVYGLRLPKSLLDFSWLKIVSLVVYSNERIKQEIIEGWKYRYLIQFNNIKRNDLIVFNGPNNSQNYFIKRCVALAGDSIKFSNNKLFVNGKLIKESGGILLKYRVKLDSLTNLNYKLFFDSLDIKFDDDWYNRKSRVKIIKLTNNQKKSLIATGKVDSIMFHEDNLYSFLKHETDESSNVSNENNYIIIPKKGMKIQLNSKHIDFYIKIIREYEDVCLTYNDKKGYYIDGKNVSFYSFKHNYYFVLGDNRSSSYDSRMFGFLPEGTIIGKACIVLPTSKFSKN